MTLRQYLILMTLGTLICWVAWVFVIFNLDPYQAGFISFLFFYASLFLALLGTFSVCGFLVRRRLLKDDEVVFRHVKKTFRQGIIFSVFILLVLFLLQLKLLAWWNLTLLVLLLVSLEGVIFASRPRNPNNYV